MSGFEPEQPPARDPGTWAPPRPPVAPRQQRGSSSCLLYGAIGCGVVIVLLAIAGVVAFFAIRGVVTGLIEDYTDTEPMTLPVVEDSDEAFQELEARVDAFKNAMENNEPTPPLELSEWDLNALAQLDPEWEEAKGKIYVSIVDDLLKGQVSLPLEDIGFEVFRGRYLNGSATFDVSFRGGRLYVIITEMEVRGKVVPDEAMEAIGEINWAEDSQQDGDTREVLRKLKSIEISDGKLIITPKQTGEGLPAEAEPEEDA